MVSKLLKWAILGICIYLCFNILTPYSSYLLNRSIRHQINYLDKALVTGGDTLLQLRYPEGYMFANCIFALSLIEYGQYTEDDKSTLANKVDRCLSNILSERSLSSFDKQLTLPYGAFYNGWTNHTLKQYIASDLFALSKHQERYRLAHETLTINISQHWGNLLESYPESIWPADNIACISSLSNDTIRGQWITMIRQQSSNSNGLINHDNTDPSIARGSSLALIQYFLSDIIAQDAVNMLTTYEDHYIDRVLGVSLVKEYINDGEQDLDSGQIVFGYGSVATLMNIRAQAQYGIREHATFGLLNMLGMPVNLFEKKYYLFKKELMLDIFMLWCSVSIME